MQTQLNGKVAKAGDTMTGTLQLPAGSTLCHHWCLLAAQQPVFLQVAVIYHSALMVQNSMKISSGGAISIDAFTTAGVVHNDASGNLSSSSYY